MIDVGENELGIDNGRNVIHNRYYSISRRKYWVEISYNNEGILSEEKLTQILEKYGTLTKEEII